MKKFNTTGLCISEKHFMADTKEKISQIMQLIEDGSYFTINLPRQYGKTTILYQIEKQLDKYDNYTSVNISFEGISSESYKQEQIFIEAFIYSILSVFEYAEKYDIVEFIENSAPIPTITKLGRWISNFVNKLNTRVVLLIDEVDKSSNNQLFLDFLGMLRSKFLAANAGKDKTFYSVILAGVHDVRSLKSKIRTDLQAKYNSPWNIAVDFIIDMSLFPKEITPMLANYSKDSNISLDAQEIARQLYDFTSGYPFLVSLICKTIDERILKGKKCWELSDIEQAVQLVIKSSNTNFESLIKNIENNSDLFDFVRRLILDNENISYVITDPIISMGTMYGVLREKDGFCKVHNKIYAELFYNHMAIRAIRDKHLDKAYQYNYFDNYIESDNNLNIEKILIKFQLFMKEQHSIRDQAFLERNGRLIFLAFIKPIINGRGYDFKEVQISEEKRLDVVITFDQNKYIVELKIWHGQAAHKRGLLQLCDYLEKINLKSGYLLIFDLSKKQGNELKSEKIIMNDKEIFSVWV